jgi:hypothetical protein
MHLHSKSRSGVKRYNPRKRSAQRKLNPMKLVWLVTMVASGLMGLAAHAAPNPWEQPAASLAEEIAGILGPGQAQLTIRNLSTIPSDEIPAIRLLLEQDLKSHGVLTSGAEIANSIRVTLSENLRERLWVAEVIEGNETRVAMVHVEPGAAQPAQPGSGLALRKQAVLTTREPVLAALETADGLVAVGPEEIVIYGQAAEGLRELKRVDIGQNRALARDPRGVIVALPGGDEVASPGPANASPAAVGFDAHVPGMACSGSYLPAQPAGEWTVHCRESDDPWPILTGPILAGPIPVGQSGSAGGSISIKAFYNAARDYFTGVVTPSVDVELPPFYSAALLPRSDGAGLLINGIDGKVQLVESGVAKPVAGTRDWGSDFAALRTGCGAGTQIIASGSGEAVADSLRAYELPGQEAIPASAPLAMGGTVTALWSASDGKSIFAVVDNATNEFEVDRVTASCD